MAFGLFDSGSKKTASVRNRDRLIEVDGECLPVRVVEHPSSKRITLRLLPGGEGVKITLPSYVKDWELDDFIARNINWIAARRARLPKPVKLDEGGEVYFQGVAHKIVHLDKMRGVVECKTINNEPCILVPGEPRFIRRKLLDFFKKQARNELEKVVQMHCASLGVRAKQIRITDTTSRWGSCSSTRTLSFSWRIIMAPPEVLDYLAAHEVAHLREMNHSDRFWALVRSICPEMEFHKTWLKKNGAKLHAVSLN